MTAAKKRTETEPQDLDVTGEVYRWDLGDPGRPRLYTLVSFKYQRFERHFDIEVYNDADRTGYQRDQSKHHVSKLASDMVANRYTPAMFYAGLLPEHLEKLKFEYGEDGSEKIVTISIPEGVKLPCLDGGHRRGALRKLWEDADEEGKKRIDNQDIPVLVLLTDGDLQDAFIDYQRGKTADSNTTRSMMDSRHLPEDIRPLWPATREVAHKLDVSKGSHLFRQIKFDTLKKAAINFSAISNWTKSELGNSIVGGVKIARKFGKSDAWLVQTYIEAFNILMDDSPKDDDDLPVLFSAGKMLAPYPRFPNGTRGASVFLIGLGNLLAFRKGYLGHDRATEDDRKRLADTAFATCNLPSPGWSLTDKRRLLGAFADAFFEDLVGDKLPAVSGVPIRLAGILSWSAYAVSQDLIPDGEAEEETTLPSIEEAPSGKKLPARSKKFAVVGGGTQG